ncbi:hypothetical protein BDZ94DRAFT_1324255 [Collybia nuda]|uniref:Uncharacterized protein n=1 Tax=Collybia nuda TaxID=64659 RepID=A0A9P5Y0N8_9AGAR|nr:hypothetical protein BDZ94DRAFT_1324255 [Collybia nuda]
MDGTKHANNGNWNARATWAVYGRQPQFHFLLDILLPPCATTDYPPSSPATADTETTYKFHVTTEGASPEWHYECAQWDEEDLPQAVSFTKIGEIPDGLDHRHLDEYLRGIPMTVSKVDGNREHLFTCRVWFREAVRQLHDSGIFVECHDIDSLENELTNRATAAEYLGRLPQIYETKLARPWQ